MNFMLWITGGLLRLFINMMDEATQEQSTYDPEVPAGNAATAAVADYRARHSGSTEATAKAALLAYWQEVDTAVRNVLDT